MFLVSFVTSFVMFSSLFMYSANISKKALKDQVFLYTNLVNERTKQYFDLYIKNINNILLLIAQNEAIYNENDEVKIIKMLEQYKQLNSDIIANIFVVFPNGKVISSNQLFYEIIGNNHVEKLYQEAFENHGYVNWSEPYYSSMLASKTVAFMKPVESRSGELVCVIIIEINLAFMTNQLGDIISNEDQTFIITTSSGNVISAHPFNTIVPFNLKTYPLEVKIDFLEKLKNISNGIDNIEYNSKSIITIKSVNTKLGWNLIILINESAFNNCVNELYITYIRIGLLFTVIMFIACFLISASFSRPIRNLVVHMDNIKGESLKFTNFLNRKDEIGRLYKSFNNMLGRIQDLLVKQQQMEEGKRKAELTALQKQIRPHFLCNTLACIKSLASQNRVEEVQESLTALIHLLQFIMGKNGEYVTLEEELEFVRHYIHIQKMRYGDIFDLNIQIDDSYKKYIIPRLLIQPIVENSIFHGFQKDLGRRGLINIYAIELDMTFHIFIEDNGTGIDETVKKEFERLRDKQNLVLEGDYQHKKFLGGNIPGISLINIHERIKLYYGQQYGVYIQSRASGGTRVELCLPKNSATIVKKDIMHLNS